MQKCEFNQFFNKTLLKMLKAIKSDYVCICPNSIIGTNEDLSQISVIDNIMTGVDTILELPYKAIYELSKLPDIDIYHEMEIRAKVYGGHPMIDSLYKINSMIASKNGIPDKYIEELKEDDRFNTIMGYKSSMGAIPYRLSDEDIIYIYKGLIPNNKPDKVSLKFYKFPDVNIAEFIIDKKYCIVNRYIAYLSL